MQHTFTIAPPMLAASRFRIAKPARQTLRHYC